MLEMTVCEGSMQFPLTEPSTLWQHALESGCEWLGLLGTAGYGDFLTCLGWY